MSMLLLDFKLDIKKAWNNNKKAALNVERVWCVMKEEKNYFKIHFLVLFRVR